MILNVEHLEMVAAIEQEGTITGASRVLHITQPALSRRLRKLETRLGARLFVRAPGRMTITPEGRRILASAARVLEDLRRAEHDVKRLAKGLDGIVRIAVECHICYHWLPRVVRRFKDAYPKVELRIMPEATRNPVAALADGTLDLAIIYHTAPVSGEMVLEELFTDELVALMSEDHPLAAREHLDAEDFRAVDLVCHYAEPERSVLDLTVLHPAGVRPRSVMELQVTPAVMEMVRAGLGVTVVPRWLLDADHRDGIVPVRVTREGLYRRWYVATSQRSVTPATRRLVEVLRSEPWAETSPPVAVESPTPEGPVALGADQVEQVHDRWGGAGQRVPGAIRRGPEAARSRPVRP